MEDMYLRRAFSLIKNQILKRTLELKQWFRNESKENKYGNSNAKNKGKHCLFGIK